MNELSQKFSELTAEMDLPDCNRALTFRNVLWLQRNMFIRNSEHPNFAEATEVLNQIRRLVVG